MKKDLALGIALIVTGSIGLVAQNQPPASVDALTGNKAHVLRYDSKAKPAVYKYDGTTVVCQNKQGSASTKTTLLDKLTTAISDLDTVVTLQRL
jgi:hypothetical protein